MDEPIKDDKTILDPPPDEPAGGGNILDAIPEELREKAGIKGEEDLVKVLTEHTTPVEPLKPEEYELPKGWEGFSQQASELKLSKEQAAGVAKAFTEASEAQMQKTQEGLNNLMEQWGDEKETRLATTKQLIKQYDTEGELIKFLNETRAGDNPVVIKFLYSIAKNLKEEGFLKSQPPTKPQKKDAAAIMYPTMDKKKEE